jgi:uncharacterized membrane protein (UPF0127 family)
VLDRRLARPWIVLLWVAAAVSCTEAEPAAAPAPAETAWVEIGSGLFELELALDPATRYLGLGRRLSVAEDGGMLFVFPESRSLEFVMRDCPIPLDIAFLDASGRIVAVHEMRPEPPRAPGESRRDYERRLPTYSSGGPARFAVETAGGRLAEVGTRVGGRAVFDAEDLARRAR